jgi:hypothetical protein
MGLIGLPAIAFCREKTLREAERKSHVFPDFWDFREKNAIRLEASDCISGPAMSVL